MDIVTEAKEVLRKNRRKTSGYQYTVPSPDTYPYQWLWDSCFHAIILSKFDIEAAKEEMRSLVSRQFENGMLPHMIYWDREAAKGAFDIAWGRNDTSSLTQPPMIAYAVWRIFEKENDPKFLEEIYPALYHYYQYLLRERDPHERHLIGIINPDESGEDNSPRFDLLLDLQPQHSLEENFHRRLKLVEENRTCNFDAPFCMKNFFWVKDVPFNAIMVENLRLLAKIAEKLGHGYDSQYFEQESQHITKAMRELMLEDGILYSTYGEQYRKITTKTWAIFSPLFARIPSADEAKALVEGHLQNEKEFKSNYSIPTVSLDDPSFDPKGFWRGPVWMSVNWFLYRGLMNYGFTEDAALIRDASRALLEKSGFREQFNPLTGEGYGARDFTWGALILDMIEE